MNEESAFDDPKVEDPETEKPEGRWSMQLSALMNLSCCINLTLNESDAIPTLLAAFTRVAFETHLSQILAKISMKASLFNMSSFSFLYSWILNILVQLIHHLRIWYHMTRYSHITKYHLTNA